MSCDLEHYFEDGAKWQEQVVLMILKGRMIEVIGDTYDTKKSEYKAKICVGRYENCREQGYVFTLMYDDRQLAHYCVFEHRNSDSICVIKFNKYCLNTPTIEEIWEGRKDKYDVTKSFNYMAFNSVTDYIIEDMKAEINKHIESLNKDDKNEE